MAVVVCQHCKAAQKMSFWELHTRLGQCYEEETSHSQNSHHYHPPQEHGIKISGSCKSFEHPGMTSPGYGHGQDVHASHSHNVLLSAVKHEEHELITPSASGRRRQSVGRANFHPILPGQLQAVKPPEEEASVVSFVQARRSSLVGSGTPAQMLQRSWSRGSGLTAGDPIAKEKKRSFLARQNSVLSKAGAGADDTSSRERGLSGDQSKTMNLDLLPHDCWAKQKSVRPLLSQRAITRSSANGAASSVNVVNGAEDEGPERKSWAAWCVQHPGRPFRNVWDILAVVFLVHDMIVIPLRFFDVPEALVLDLLSWFTQIFWNLDIIASFLTGYYQDGNLVMEPVKIALNYAKTWLAFDMTVVSLDWIILLLAADSDAQGVHRLSKTVRVLRFLRMVRILRLAKISRMSEAVQEQIQSQSANIHYSLFKSIFRLLLLCHLMACSWYGIGRLSEESDSWIGSIEFSQKTVLYQYTTCYHWAMCQLGVGGVAIFPTNTTERVFGIFSAFTALMTFSTLVSKMTSLMSSLYHLKEEELEQFRLLKRYLVYNDIPLHLSQRIIRFLQHGYRLRDEALSAGAHLPILDLLSQSLQGELQFERFRGCFSDLAFTSALLTSENRQTIQVMHKLAMNAVGSSVVAHDDLVFCMGDWATGAYFTHSGSLKYHDDDEEAHPVAEHQWVSEMALWTPWLHMGDLIAEDVSRLVVLNVEAFCKVVGDSAETRTAASTYAKAYLDTLRQEMHWTDLYVENQTRKGNKNRVSSIQSEIMMQPGGERRRRLVDCLDCGCIRR